MLGIKLNPVSKRATRGTKRLPEPINLLSTRSCGSTQKVSLTGNAQEINNQNLLANDTFKTFQVKPRLPGAIQFHEISLSNMASTFQTISSRTLSSTVREITKSSSTFSATNINSNTVWFLPLHDNFVWNFIFDTKLSSIYLAKGEKCLVFRLSFVNLQRATDGTHVFDAKYRYVFVV